MAENPWSLGRALRGLFVKPTIDETTWDDLETALLTADFGPDETERLIDELREKVDRYRTTDPRDLQRMLRETLEEHFAKFDTTLRLTERPAVVLVVGVNGTGKTTTVGKLTRVLVDTAGRLHTKGGLMDELGKIKRVIEKQAPISEVLLVLDATTGQNGLMQAQAFLDSAGVTGLVLTKLDGSAKGGFVLAVQERTGIPVKLLGQGEGINDLTGFTPHVFAASLVD